MAKQTENNVGIYMRLSKEDMLDGDSLSIENQKMMLTKFVREKGWNLISEYVDAFTTDRIQTNKRSTAEKHAI